MTEWLEHVPSYVPVAISVFAVFVSGIAAAIAWLGYRVSRRNELRALDALQPDVTVIAGAIEGHPEWLDVGLTVKNNFPYALTVDSVTVMRPMFTRALHSDDVRESDGAGGREVKKTITERGKRTLKFGWTLMPKGNKTDGLIFGSGDTGLIGIAVQNRRTLFTKATYVRVSMSSRKHDVRRSQRHAITVKIP